MSISSRRRAIMSAEDSDIVYFLENQAVNTGDYVSTHVAFLKQNTEGTILFDYTADVRIPASGDGRIAAFVLIWDSVNSQVALYIGKPSAYDNRVSARWYGSAAIEVQSNTIEAGRFRIAITHSKNSPDVTIKFKKGSGQVISLSLSTEEYFNVNGTVLFGGTSGSNGLVKGTINKGVIYNRILTASEINAFFAS